MKDTWNVYKNMTFEELEREAHARGDLLAVEIAELYRALAFELRELEAELRD